MVSRIKIAEPDIVTYFDKHDKNVFTIKEISKVISKNRDDWRLAKSMPIVSFVDHFIRRGKINEVKIEGKSINTVRYIWGKASDYKIALSLKKDCHLSHYSAIFIHALTDQIPKTIYINFEQSPKPKPTGELLQENIDKAFKNKARTSSNIVNFNNIETILINGKNTGRLGVIDVPYFENEWLSCTDIERTLIDIVVRPVYSGSVWEVLKAYKNAKDNFSINRLLAYLKKLDYIYPYHQAVGFYLERAGYKQSLLKLFKDMGLEYDFYITYNVKEFEYIKEWRLYIPKGF